MSHFVVKHGVFGSGQPTFFPAFSKQEVQDRIEQIYEEPDEPWGVIFEDLWRFEFSIFNYQSPELLHYIEISQCDCDHPERHNRTYKQET